jgi:phytoene dehydrogenase-like protein
MRQRSLLLTSSIIATLYYRFDTGPSLLLLPAAIREAFADLGYNSDDFLEMRRVSPAYKVRLIALI